MLIVRVPRYVHADGASREIELCGREVVIHDAEGERRETHGSPADARAALLAIASALDEAGYVLEVEDDEIALQRNREAIARELPNALLGRKL
jgi:hypothetical protein